MGASPVDAGAHADPGPTLSAITAITALTTMAGSEPAAPPSTN
ncbi:hypothetical protein ACQ859_24115 [Roseateles chitinivorans]